MKKSNIMSSVLILLICTIVLLSVFAGCQKKGDETSKTETYTSTDKEGESKKEPVVLEFFVSEHVNWPITNDTPVLQEVQKRINVKIEFIPVPVEGFQDKLNITMASGQLPDLMCLGINEIKNYGMKGAFLPLNEMVENSAPNLKKLITSDVKIKITADNGNCYGIPIMGGDRRRNGWLIRKDWLDKLNMNEPDTIDEWEMTLKAFKDNGNILTGSDQDIVPWATRAGSWFLVEHTIPAFGLHPEDWTADGDNLLYNYTQDRYKQCLLWLRKIYKQELLDQEYVLLSTKMWEEKISSGKAGATTDYLVRTDVFNSIAREQNPDFNLVALVPLAGPEGHRGTLAYDSVDTMYNAGITKDCKNKDAAIKYLDFMFSDEGAELTTYGVEGITHTIKDGKKVWVDEILNDKDNIALRAKHGIFQWTIARRYLPEETEFLSGPNYIEGGKRAEPYYIDPFPSLNFAQEENEKIKDISSAVEPIINGFRDQYITGAIPEEDWDKFQKQLKDARIEELIEIYQNSYKKYLKMQ